MCLKALHLVLLFLFADDARVQFHGLCPGLLVDSHREEVDIVDIPHGYQGVARCGPDAVGRLPGLIGHPLRGRLFLAQGDGRCFFQIAPREVGEALFRQAANGSLVVHQPDALTLVHEAGPCRGRCSPVAVEVVEQPRRCEHRGPRGEVLGMFILGVVLLVLGGWGSGLHARQSADEPLLQHQRIGILPQGGHGRVDGQVVEVADRQSRLAIGHHDRQELLLPHVAPSARERLAHGGIGLLAAQQTEGHDAPHLVFPIDAVQAALSRPFVHLLLPLGRIVVHRHHIPGAGIVRSRQAASLFRDDRFHTLGRLLLVVFLEVEVQELFRQRQVPYRRGPLLADFAAQCLDGHPPQPVVAHALRQKDACLLSVFVHEGHHHGDIVVALAEMPDRVAPLVHPVVYEDALCIAGEGSKPLHALPLYVCACLCLQRCCPRARAYYNKV